MMRSLLPLTPPNRTATEEAILDIYQDPTTRLWQHMAIEGALKDDPAAAAEAFQRLADLFGRYAQEVYSHLPASGGREH